MVILVQNLVPAVEFNLDSIVSHCDELIPLRFWFIIFLACIESAYCDFGFVLVNPFIKNVQNFLETFFILVLLNLIPHNKGA